MNGADEKLSTIVYENRYYMPRPQVSSARALLRTGAVYSRYPGGDLCDELYHETPAQPRSRGNLVDPGCGGMHLSFGRNSEVPTPWPTGCRPLPKDRYPFT